MRKNHSIDQLSSATVRQAQNQAAILQRDIGKLRDSISSLTRGIRAPVIRTPRTSTKRTTSTSIWAGIAGIAGVELLDAGLLGDTDFKASATAKIGGYSFTDSASQTGSGYDSGSFYTSDAQAAGDQADILALGQRIR